MKAEKLEKVEKSAVRGNQMQIQGAKSQIVELCKRRVMAGQQLTKQQATALLDAPLEQLSVAADQIRRHYCGNRLDWCTIINAKSGSCSEDCKYCAQSRYYQTDCVTYGLRPIEEIVALAKYNAERGVLRYSIVTSGRGVGNRELSQIGQAVRQIKAETSIKVCASLGLLDAAQYRVLADSGIERIHNNLETSADYFPQMCSTHRFEDKIAAIKTAQAAGMEVCSGGIFGIGESAEDRLDLAFALRELGIKSVPINLLNPIAGTPYAARTVLSASAVRRIVALFRFILPAAFIRLAGGRGLLADKGRGCLQSGANALITGDMLTTAGISIERDLVMIRELGFEVG